MVSGTLGEQIMPTKLDKTRYTNTYLATRGVIVSKRGRGKLLTPSPLSRAYGNPNELAFNYKIFKFLVLCS
jgi:hypothetical protein